MAINFPNTPVDGSTYTYQTIKYTFIQPNNLVDGYWTVLTTADVGVATPTEIDVGTDNAKYISPLGLVGSKYVREDENTEETVLKSGGLNRLVAKADGVDFVGKMTRNGVDYPFPVGACYLTIASHNPATLFGGTWFLLTGDASLGFGDGSAQTGVPTGNNTPTVPVPYHNHTISHDHPNVTTSSNGAHSHTQNINNSSNGTTNTQSSGGGSQGTIGMNSAGNHTHTLDVPNFSGSSGYSGSNGITLDVRGAKIAINVWVRTA